MQIDFNAVHPNVGDGAARRDDVFAGKETGGYAHCFNGTIDANTAGHLLYLICRLTVFAVDGSGGRGDGPASLATGQRRRLVFSGLHFAVQHVDWLYLLVSRFGAGGHRRRGTAAIAAAVFWSGAGRAGAA